MTVLIAIFTVLCAECEGRGCPSCGDSGRVPACAACGKHAQDERNAPCCSKECREVWEARNPGAVSGGVK